MWASSELFIYFTHTAHAIVIIYTLSFLDCRFLFVFHFLNSIILLPHESHFVYSIKSQKYVEISKCAEFTVFMKTDHNVLSRNLENIENTVLDCN